MILVGAMLTSLSVHAQTYEAITNFSESTENNSFSSYDDPILNSMILEYGLTPEEVTRIDDFIAKELSKPQSRNPLVTIASVVGIVAGIVGTLGATYQAGRYAARQCEVRLGLTKSYYEENRWTFRAALSALVFAGGLTGASVALGFDDYFMGL